MAVETIIESIGASKDYATVSAWKVAHDGEDLTTGGADGDGIIYIGELYDSIVSTALLYLNEVGAGTVTSATQYRWLRAASGAYYDPTDGTGAKLRNTGGSGVIRVREAHFRIGPGIALHMDQNVSTTLRVVRFDRASWMNGVFLEHSQGSNASNAIVFTSSGIPSGQTVQISSCLLKGSNNRTTAAIGPRYGFDLDATTGGSAGDVEVFNCTVYGISQNNETPIFVPPQGVGMVTGGNTTAHNNIIVISQVSDYDLTATPSAFTYNLSSDATATGTGSLINKLWSDVLEDAVNGDFSLALGSPAIDAGTDLSGSWYEGTPEDFLEVEHDNDGLGWEMGAFNYDTIAPISAEISGESSLSSTMARFYRASATLNQESTIDANADFYYYAQAAIDAETSFLAVLSAETQLSAEISAESEIIITLDTLARLGALIEASGSLSSVLSLLARLSASVDAQKTLSVTLRAMWQAQALIEAYEEIEATLTITGNAGFSASIDAHTELLATLTTCANRILTSTDLDVDLIPETLALLQDLGKQVTFFEEFAGGIYAPEVGEYSPPRPAPTEHVVDCSPPLTFELRFAGGLAFERSNLKLGDVRLIAAASGVSFTPVEGMKVTFDSSTWYIEKIGKIYTGELIGAYDLLLRGGEAPTPGVNTSELDGDLTEAALELVEESGKSVTFVVPGADVYNPATGDVTEGTETEISVDVSPPENYRDTFSGANTRVFMPALNAALQPFRGQTVHVDKKLSAPIDADTLFGIVNSGESINKITAITSSVAEEWDCVLYVRKKFADSTDRLYLRPSLRDVGEVVTERFQAIFDEYAGTISGVATFNGGPYSSSNVLVENVNSEWWKLTLTLTDNAGDAVSQRWYVFPWSSSGVRTTVVANTLWGAGVQNGLGAEFFADPNDFSLWSPSAGATVTVNTYSSPGTQVETPCVFSVVDVKYLYSGEQIALYELALSGNDIPTVFSSTFTDLDTDFLAESLDLTNELGKEVQFFLRDETFSPSTGNAVLNYTRTKTHHCTPPQEYAEKFIDGEVIKEGDARIFLPAIELEFTPHKGQRTLIDCEVWTVEEIGLVYSGEQIAMYSLQIRR